MELDINEIMAYLDKGKLTRLPSKRKKKLFVLEWLTEHIPSDRSYTQQEFNELLEKLHTFHDPATLRRELYDYDLIDRNADGREYRLNPDRPSLEELLKRYCGETKQRTLIMNDKAVTLSERDIESAKEFRDRIRAEALERIQVIDPKITEVIDRYPVEDYFQQVWDYPGTWYTVVAIPESVKSREALIDIIVRDTLKQR